MTDIGASAYADRAAGLTASAVPASRGSIPCAEGIRGDEIRREGMIRGSSRLLSAIYEARGLPEPKPVLTIEQFKPTGPVVNVFERKPGVVRRLIDSVSEDFGITHGELIGTGRNRVFVHARSVVIRLLLDRGYSSASIGRRYLRRDHSSILWSRDNFDVYARLNPMVKASYERHARMMCEAA